MTKSLTDAQIAAVKQRTVGRAAPGVASRPSVDGFRASEPMVNKAKRETGQAKTKIQADVKPKIKVSDFFRFCPSDRSLKLGRLQSQVGLQEKGVFTC